MFIKYKHIEKVLNFIKIFLFVKKYFFIFVIKLSYYLSVISIICFELTLVVKNLSENINRTYRYRVLPN